VTNFSRSRCADLPSLVYSAFVPHRTWLMLWWTMWGDLRRVSTDIWCCFPHLDFGLGIYVRHGPESQTVFVAFSCTFLIKVRPLLLSVHKSNLSDIEVVIATEICVIYFAGTARRDHKNSRTRSRVSQCSRYRCRRSPWSTTLFSFHQRVTRACENPTNYFIPLISVQEKESRFLGYGPPCQPYTASGETGCR
jgi:hypothetical protein